MRNASITARELFEQQQEKLALRWLAGRKGEVREIESGETNARRPSLNRRKAAQASSMKGNPVVLSAADLVAILRAAL